MSNLNDLYQEILLEHNNKPRKFRKLDPHSHTADGYNPLCGDQISLYLQITDGVIVDVGFQGKGCAISRASASLMTQSIKGHNIEDAENVFDQFRKMLTDPDAVLDYDQLGDLETLAGVSEFPSRIKCAILAWHTMKAAIEHNVENVTTE